MSAKRDARSNGSSPSTLALDLVRRLERLDPKKTHLLISCSKTKGTHRAPAGELYTSALFIKSRRLADAYQVPFSILSAKHGLVAPDEPIDPYDVTLKGADRQFRDQWGKRTARQIDDAFAVGKRLLLLAGSDYVEPLRENLPRFARRVELPLDGLSLGLRLSVLDNAYRICNRQKFIADFYGLLERLSGSLGRRTLPEIVAGGLPPKGVYFFFDPAEPTSFSKKLPRLVRIGTHAVSLGSKATLRNRLRTHFGTREGGGNHRASVFRLHVGQSLIARHGRQDEFPDWGKGQSAVKSITEREERMEREVSAYLSRLLVLYIPIEDNAGKSSMRAVMEHHLIALMTEDRAFLEKTSEDWLGRWSSRPEIATSGLWNVRSVGERADLKIVEMLGRLMDKSVPAAKT
ncbi:hypothetical protein QMZ05_02220 [Bradyrhizobium sp. INPA03-11B]|uniref:DUF6884 domain-containing protein n=1 Tax=Bradyrhizobium sp. INPA03-11B TaxID=418598 RepID=UPI00338DECF4